MTNNNTATGYYPVTRARLIADLREIATEARTHGDLAAANEALELAWRIAVAGLENRTLH